MDEATDRNKDCLLITYVRFIDGDDMREELLFCKQILSPDGRHVGKCCPRSLHCEMKSASFSRRRAAILPTIFSTVTSTSLDLHTSLTCFWNSTKWICSCTEQIHTSHIWLIKSHHSSENLTCGCSEWKLDVWTHSRTWNHSLKTTSCRTQWSHASHASSSTLMPFSFWTKIDWLTYPS